MKLKFQIFLLFLFLAGSSLSFANTTFSPKFRLSLEECIDRAVHNNEEIKAMHYDIEKVLAQKIEATKRYVPVIKYKYNLAPVPRNIDNPIDSLSEGNLSVFNSIKVEMGVPITTFGRIEILQEMADLGVDLSTFNQRKKTDQVVLDVYKLYQGILLARQLKSLGYEALDAIQKNVKALEKDEAPDQIQLLKLKVVLYEVQRQVSEAQVKELLALATLKVQMGLEDDVDFDIKARSLKRERLAYGSFEDILAKAKENRPEYKLIQKGLELKQKEIDLAKKEYWPTLGVGAFFEGGYSPAIEGDEGSNDFTNPFNYTRAGIGFELKGELDFRKIKSKIEVANAGYLKSIGEKRAAFRGLELDLRQAYQDLNQHKYLLSRSDEEQKAARQIVFLIKSNLDIGLGEKKDYYEALQSYLVLQARGFESVFKHNIAVATLKMKMGELYAHQKEDI